MLSCIFVKYSRIFNAYVTGSQTDMSRESQDTNMVVRSCSQTPGGKRGSLTFTTSAVIRGPGGCHGFPFHGSTCAHRQSPGYLTNSSPSIGNVRLVWAELALWARSYVQSPSRARGLHLPPDAWVPTSVTKAHENNTAGYSDRPPLLNIHDKDLHKITSNPIPSAGAAWQLAHPEVSRMYCSTETSVFHTFHVAVGGCIGTSGWVSNLLSPRTKCPIQYLQAG